MMKKDRYAVWQNGMRMGEKATAQVTMPMSKGRAMKHAKISRKLFPNMDFRIKKIKKR